MERMQHVSDTSSTVIVPGHVLCWPALDHFQFVEGVPSVWVPADTSTFHDLTNETFVAQFFCHSWVLVGVSRYESSGVFGIFDSVADMTVQNEGFVYVKPKYLSESTNSRIVWHVNN